MILHASAGWIAVDKPAGMVVIPARTGDPADCLQHRLQELRGERLWIVHRLDRDTTGVLLFARTAAAHRALNMAWDAVRKTYTAITRGVPEGDGGVIDTPLHTARKGKMRPAYPEEADSLASRTLWRVERRWARGPGALGLWSLQPETGRQHQLRVHLRSIGCPLLVDPFYGGCDREVAAAWGIDAPDLVRTPLHAASLTFPDPDTGQMRTLEAPLPTDMERWVTALDAGAGAATPEAGPIRGAAT